MTMLPHPSPHHLASFEHERGDSPSQTPTTGTPAAGTSGKRKLIALGGLSQQANFPRKRSVTACQLCRARKTKCDNQRPTCSKCMELSAGCVYHDQADPEAPATQILQRLDYLINLVQTGPVSQLAAYGRGHDSLGEAAANPMYRSATLDFENRTQDAAAIYAGSAIRGTDREHEIQVPAQAYFGSSEDILAWAIFDGKYHRRSIEALIFDPTLPSDDLAGPPTSPIISADSNRESFEDPRTRTQPGQGVREEDVPHLVEAFLFNVHVKNPIFDPDYLRRMAKAVVEEGFGWKASTCLVLIVCALGAISSPFSRQPTSNLGEYPNYADASLTHSPAYNTAEAYYTASRKRVGLLRNTLLATECYFMTGVYEMYSLRPLQAAISFNRACVTFQTLTWMNSEYSITEDQIGKARASRLYWSCLKSEHEVSVEFRFPSSGLTKLNYTNHFPPPPLAKTAEQLYRIHPGSDAGADVTPSPSMPIPLENGWYYYLADIAARGIMRRVIKSFYEQRETTWLEVPLNSILQTAEELDRQLTEWHRTLPSVVSFDINVAAGEELAYHLQARAIEIRERIYRPFLYLILHEGNEPSKYGSLEGLVQLHATTCYRLIQQWNVRHRHHGTWLMARQSFASALLLMAGRRSGLATLPEEHYEDGVQASISTLRYWEGEAPDLRASRLILEDLAREITVLRPS